MKRIVSAITSLSLFGLTASIGLADSIEPASVSAFLDVGGTATVHKTVTVSAGTPVSSKVDVYFLADTTGSMYYEIAAIQASAASILSSVAGLGDVGFAVGEYKDVGDAYIYRLNTDVTTTQATAQAGINLWGASGGGDYPEANLFALETAANTTTWRSGSEKILVWFGDAPGHDPSASGVTEASATAALQAKSINVQAVDVGSLNSTGQASRIAAATGGNYYAGIDSSSIVSTITAAITSAVSTYTTVGLDISEAPAGVGVTYIPAAGYTGSYDRSIERTFGFDVTFTAVTPGTYDFNIYGTVDGGRVAAERDHIVVGASGVPDGGSSILLLGAALTGIGLVRRKLRR